jgi:hypothetical protein
MTAVLGGVRRFGGASSPDYVPGTAFADVKRRLRLTDHVVVS